MADSGVVSRKPEPEHKTLERASVMAVALAALPNEDEVRREFEAAGYGTFPSLEEALRNLAALTDERIRITQRTVSLRLLAKAARALGIDLLRERAGGGLGAYAEAQKAEAERIVAARAQEDDEREDDEREDDEREDERRRVKGADDRERSTADDSATAERSAEQTQADEPAAETSAPPPPPGSAEAELVDALTVTADPSTQTLPTWEAFASAAAGPLAFSDEEINLPTCDDDDESSFKGVPATRIVTWFTTPRDATDFARWTDPRTWPIDCSIFFEDMVTTDTTIPPIGSPTTWTARFTEYVRLTPTKLLETPLDFTRVYLSDEHFALYFEMPPNVTTRDLLVDAGSILVDSDDLNPPAEQTMCQAEKFVKWADPAAASWPSLSCDLFWTELTILAALGCNLDH